jgi:hypothetical protein
LSIERTPLSVSFVLLQHAIFIKVLLKIGEDSKIAGLIGQQLRGQFDISGKNIRVSDAKVFLTESMLMIILA